MTIRTTKEIVMFFCYIHNAKSCYNMASDLYSACQPYMLCWWPPLSNSTWGWYPRSHVGCGGIHTQCPPLPSDIPLWYTHPAKDLGPGIPTPPKRDQGPGISPADRQTPKKTLLSQNCCYSSRLCTARLPQPYIFGWPPPDVSTDGGG